MSTKTHTHTFYFSLLAQLFECIFLYLTPVRLVINTEQFGINTEQSGINTEQFGINTEQFGINAEQFTIFNSTSLEQIVQTSLKEMCLLGSPRCQPNWDTICC